MDIQKWNYETLSYEPYDVPEEWELWLYSRDMDLVVNCASCGDTMTYGEGYSSMEIHTNIGLAYPVCGDCYELEWARRKKHIKKRNDSDGVEQSTRDK